MGNKNISHLKILLGLLICSEILMFATSFILTNNSLYFDFYSEKLAYERIVALIDQQKKWEWLGYVLLPVIYLLKFFIISCVLLMGTFLAGYKVRFRDVFHVSVQAEFVFLIPVLLKLIWFGFFFRDYTLNDLMAFAPLSLVNLFDTTAVQQWFVPLLTSISLFELTYWFLLSFGIYQLINRSYSSSFGLVAASYGSAWIIWQVFVIFLMINLS